MSKSASINSIQACARSSLFQPNRANYSAIRSPQSCGCEPAVLCFQPNAWWTLPLGPLRDRYGFDPIIGRSSVVGSQVPRTDTRDEPAYFGFIHVSHSRGFTYNRVADCGIVLASPETAFFLLASVRDGALSGATRKAHSW